MADAAANDLARRAVCDLFAVHTDAPPAGSEAGDDLGQLRLAVAGDRGEADNLARADLERRTAQCRQKRRMNVQKTILLIL